jgi:glycerophosphoryl diester phosphodiesterase
LLISKSIPKSHLISAMGLLLFFLLAICLQTHAEPCKNPSGIDEAKSIRVVGHRGVAGLRPENTLSGFSHALALGVDAIELDVLMTADKNLVVHHDFGLKSDIARHPGGTWLNSGKRMQINKMTVPELKIFDVGRLNPNTRYAARYPDQEPSDGEHIPLLREVIQLIKTSGRESVQLWIEIKTTPETPDLTPSPETIAENVLALLRAQQFTLRVKILSFDWRSLIHIQKIAPSIPTVYLTSDTKQFKAASFMNPWESEWTAGLNIGDYQGSIPRTILAAGGNWWAPKYTQIKAKQVKEAHRLGICVSVWTPDSTRAIKKMIELGVDAIITNRPDRLLQILTEQ